MPQARLLKIWMKELSLVPRGANQLATVYKTDGDESDVTLDTVTKFDEEQGELLAVVYAPEQRDSQGHIASKTVIKEMAYDAAKEGYRLDIKHAGRKLSTEEAFVAERFIVAKGDERFANWKNYQGETVDLTGAFANVIKIEDSELREKFKSGEWNGVSLGGDALLRPEPEPAKKTATTKDPDMDPEQLAEALKKSNADLAAAIVEGVVEGIAKMSENDSKKSKKKDDDEHEDDEDGDKKMPAKKSLHDMSPSDRLDVMEKAELKKLDADWELKTAEDYVQLDLEEMAAYEQDVQEVRTKYAGLRKEQGIEAAPARGRRRRAASKQPTTVKKTEEKTADTLDVFGSLQLSEDEKAHASFGSEIAAAAKKMGS